MYSALRTASFKTNPSCDKTSIVNKQMTMINIHKKNRASTRFVVSPVKPNLCPMRIAPGKENCGTPFL
jgi:hypothetical protein